MKILTIAYRYPPEGLAGVAQSIMPMAEAMVTNNHQVLIVVRTPQQSLVDEMVNGIRVLRIPSQWSLEEAGKQLISAAANFSPDIIEVHLLTGFRRQDVLNCKKACQVPLIHYLHIYSLICRDNIRADIEVAFFVRVNNTAVDIRNVAQSLGCRRASSRDALIELFDAYGDG